MNHKFIKTAAVILSILSLSLVMTACNNSGKGNEKVTEFRFTSPDYTWPGDSKLFKDIPAPADSFKSIIDTKNENGYSWEMRVEKMKYAEFRKYILKLEDSGFKIYDSIGSGTLTTETLLPEKLPSGREFATWSGNGKLLWITANWYSDKQLKKTGGEDNAVFYFSTYNPRTTDK